VASASQTKEKFGMGGSEGDAATNNNFIWWTQYTDNSDSST
jgi:hypothetical protein